MCCSPISSFINKAIYEVSDFIGKRQDTAIDHIASVIPVIGIITYHAKCIFNKAQAATQPLQQVIKQHNIAKGLFIGCFVTTLVALVAFQFFVFGAIAAGTTLLLSGVGYLCYAALQGYGISENQRLATTTLQADLIWW